MMFKLALISALIVAAYCMPADKDKSADQLEQSETSWNSAWANPAANPNAAWGGQWGANNQWNRWNNPAGADPRWNRWGSNDPWNRWGAAGNQWNRHGAWPAAGGAAAGRWNTW